MTSALRRSLHSSLRCVLTSRLMIAGLVCTALFGRWAIAEAVRPEYRGPVQVELTAYLDVHHLHKGSTFFVKVVNDWAGLGCFFRSGQIIEARVELAVPRGNKSHVSQLGISFSKAQCVYNKATVDLVLAAVLGDSSETAQHAQLPIVRYSLAKTGSVSTIQGSFNFNGIDLMALSGKPGKEGLLKPGAVLGVRGVTLRMGAGPDRSSILESSTRDLWVEKETVLVLVPASVAFVQPSLMVTESPVPTKIVANAPIEERASDRAMPGAQSATGATPPAAMEFQSCEPPACSVDLPSASQGNAGNPSLTLAMRPFGYAPRPQREIGELDNDDALVWLGSARLMLAFNPHTLIPRDGERTAGATIRRIHAVVLDLPSQKIVSTADWDLPDTEQYLWQLSKQRILVHMGDELRVLNGDLEVENRIPLDGPLAFVRTSPNGELMAIAVMHESHSAELHSRLFESLGHEPDEDVEIRILDREFKVVAQATSSRKIMPPTLLNEGQVRLLASSHTRYRLELLPWQGKSATVARFSSACLPMVSSFAPDLVFVTTCASESRVQEYRVLRPNGSVVLRGKYDPQCFGQQVLGSTTKFVVKILHAKQAVAEGAIFHGSDLDYAEVRIFGAGNGARISAIHTAAPPPTHGGFALSGDGSQLAVVSNSQVTVFALQ